MPQTSPSTPLGFSFPLQRKKRTPDCLQNAHTSCTLHSKKRGLRPHVWNPALENTIQVQQLEQSRARSPVQTAIPWMRNEEAPGWSMHTHNGNQVAIRRVKDVL